MVESEIANPVSVGTQEPRRVSATQIRENGIFDPTPDGQDVQQEGPKPTAKPPTAQRVKRPNYAKLHAQSLPVVIHPLPAFVPHNPLSLLRIAYIICSQYFFPPSSHPPSRHVAYFSHETRSIHVTDPASVRALWEHGFFGKGSLSRSEPTWVDREKQRRGVLSGQILAEDYTQKRRDERKAFKNERARLESEAIEEQLRKEGKLVDEPTVDAAASNSSAANDSSDRAHDADASASSGHANGSAPETESRVLHPTDEQNPPTSAGPAELAIDETLQNEEHLQLTLEEAFFLVYGLGVLDVIDQQTNRAIDPLSLFQLSRSSSYFPPCEVSSLRPDDSFLLKYVVYHHFRSRGWVARDGVKFSVDYMIYNRGPVFSHAEFAVQIVPSYSDPYWADENKPVQSPWWWLHCVNRVQSQVLKTLVLVYVEVPAPLEGEVHDIGAMLKRYKVREFVLRRWVANRMRA